MAKKRILIVDDDSESSHFLKEDLEKAGPYEVFEENHGEQAMTAVRFFRPDVVLLDIVIPDKDGVEIAREILAEEPHPKIVFMTSIVSIDETRSGPIGSQRFLSKDATLPQIISCLETL